MTLIATAKLILLFIALLKLNMTVYNMQIIAFHHAHHTVVHIFVCHVLSVYVTCSVCMSRAQCVCHVLSVYVSAVQMMLGYINVHVCCLSCLLVAEAG